MRNVMIVAAAMTLAACGTPVDTSRVQVITAGQKEKACRSLGVVTGESGMGFNKHGQAMQAAMIQVVKRGGNGIYVVNVGTISIDTATVTAEALSCQL